MLWDLLTLDRLDRFPTAPRSRCAASATCCPLCSAWRPTCRCPPCSTSCSARTGYSDLYRRENEEDQARLENIREFLSAAQTFTESRAFQSSDEDLLTAFLDHVALVSDLDGWQGEKGVTLMTLHSAKGLEFPIVFLPGLEDGSCPTSTPRGGRKTSRRSGGSSTSA